MKNKKSKIDKEQSLKLGFKDILAPLGAAGSIVFGLSWLLYQAIKENWPMVVRDLLSSSVAGLMAGIFASIIFWIFLERGELGRRQRRIRSAISLIIEQTDHFLTDLAKGILDKKAAGTISKIKPESKSNERGTAGAIKSCMSSVEKLQGAKVNLGQLRKLQPSIRIHLEFLEKVSALYQKYLDYHSCGHDFVEQTSQLYRLSISLESANQRTKTPGIEKNAPYIFRNI